MSAHLHGDGAVSPWVARWAHLVPAGTPVLDVACGTGRNAVYFAQRGHAVTGVDVSELAIHTAGTLLPASTRLLVADLENAPWPLNNPQGLPEVFGAVVVTHYLWRALWPTLLASLAPGGVLIYETFAHGNASVGKPSRPDFLLQPGELLRVCTDLRVVAFEDGFSRAPERFVQRIVAVHEASATAADTVSGTGLTLCAHEKTSYPASIAPIRYPL